MTGDGIHNGDLVVIKHQEYAEFGDVVVAFLADEGATVKRLMRKEESIVLMPSNPTYEPIPVPDIDALQIQGRVIGIARWQ